MVGELGATFKNAEGGVSSWVNATMGAKWAYYAGWTLLGLPRIKQRYRWPESNGLGHSWQH